MGPPEDTGAGGAGGGGGERLRTWDRRSDAGILGEDAGGCAEKDSSSSGREDKAGAGGPVLEVAGSPVWRWKAEKIYLGH